jgi:hypothetical protein
MSKSNRSTFYLLYIWKPDVYLINNEIKIGKRKCKLTLPLFQYSISATDSKLSILFFFSSCLSSNPSLLSTLGCLTQLLLLFLGVFLKIYLI